MFVESENYMRVYEFGNGLIVIKQISPLPSEAIKKFESAYGPITKLFVPGLGYVVCE